MKKKTIALLMAVVIVIGAAVGGTIAYLTDRTDTVVNTFTIGNINIDLAETTGDEYKMVPGTDLPKDPKVTVEAGSEACWLFIKAEESANLDDFITYAIADGWTAGTGTVEGKNGVPVGVWFREQAAVPADADPVPSYPVLKDNEVSVKDTVTKAMLDALTEDTLPTLSFTAYAVQKPGFATAADAWAEASK